jgi:hypothetical protein
MDITSVLKNEIFRPLTTVVVPGAVALGPFVLLLEDYVPSVKQFAEGNHSGFGLVLLIAILAAGLVLEDLGSWIEVCWDGCLKRKHPSREKVWGEYLQLKTGSEIIGQRYLRTLLLRLKFELSMAPAVLAFAIGLLWLNGVHRFWRASAMAWVATFLAALVAYLLKESYDSAEKLGTLHESITTAVRNEEMKAPSK